MPAAANQIGIEYYIDLRKLRTNLNQAKNAFRQFNDWVNSTSQKTAGFEQPFRKAGDAFSRLKRSFAGARGTFSGAADSMKNFQEHMSRGATFAGRLGLGLRGLGGDVRMLAGDFKNLGLLQMRWYASQQLLFGLVQGLRNGITAAVDFQEEMSKVATALQLDPDIHRSYFLIEQKIRDVLIETGKNIDELATIMWELKSAGLETSEVLGAFRHATDLTIGSVVNAQDATRILAGLYRIFGNSLEGVTTSQEKFQKIVDIVSGTLNVSQVDMNGLIKGYSYLANASDLAGLKLSEVSAVLAVLNDRMIASGRAGRGARSALVQLVKNWQSISDRMGIVRSEYDTFLDFLHKLRDKWATMGDDIASRNERLAATFEKFGLRGGPAIASLVAHLEKVDEIIQNIESGMFDNLTKLMAEERLSTAAAEWAKLVAQLKEFSITLLDSGEPLAKLVRYMRHFTGAVMILIHGPLSLLDANIFALYKAFEALGKAMILDFSGAKKAAKEGIDHLASWTERVYRFNQRMSGFGEGLASIAEAGEQALKKGAEGTTQIVETWAQKRAALFATLTDTHRQAADSMTEIEKNALAISILAWEKTADRKFESLKDMNVDIVVAEEQAYQKRLQLENKYFNAIRKTQEKIVKEREKSLEKLLAIEEAATDKLIAIANKAVTGRISIRDKILTYEGTITDELMKLTKTEADYNLWAEKQKYKKRKDLLGKWLKELERLKAISPTSVEEVEAIQRLIEQVRALQTETDKLYKTEKKPTDLYDPSDFGAGFIAGLKEVGEELANEYEIWKNMAKELAASMRDTLSDVLFDPMMNELKSAEDYWRAFTTSVKRMIADMAAQWMMFKAFGDLGKTGWGLAGKALGAIAAIGGGGGTGGGATAPAPGPGMINVHQGGFPSFHPGGLASDEILAVLRKKEFVIQEPSVRSIGTRALEHINKTGTLPQQPTIVHNHNYQIRNDFIDPEGLDKVLRTRGAGAIRDVSLGSYNFARQQRDPRVR